MTVREAMQYADEFLAGHQIPQARVEAEWLLAHLRDTPRTMLHCRGGELLDAGQLERLDVLLRRRATREPLQHLLGSVSFCGFEIKVGPQALIPRPETEQLAERAWTHLKSSASEARGLDFGTGTGCLAIAITRHCPGATMHALDVSPEALTLARENAAANGVAERIILHRGNGFQALPGGLLFDLIVTNPPYIPSGEIDMLAPEVREFDPRLALDGGADGLSFYRMLANEARDWLRPGAPLMCEFGDGQEADVEEIFAARGWGLAKIVSDLAGTPRIGVLRRAV